MLRTTVLSGWGPEPLVAEQQRDVLEIVEDRNNAGSLIITSEVPVDRGHAIVGNPTLADAILDRFIHNSHSIELKGESLRKLRCEFSLNRLSVRVGATAAFGLARGRGWHGHTWLAS
jgi:hypothetical protein